MAVGTGPVIQVHLALVYMTRFGHLDWDRRMIIWHGSVVNPEHARVRHSHNPIKFPVDLK